MEKLREYLEKSTRPCYSISREYKSEIDSFEQVDSSDYAGRKWHKVYYQGTDAKYGHFMICLETRQRRSSTMSEFYGNGVVD